MRMTGIFRAAIKVSTALRFIRSFSATSSIFSKAGSGVSVTMPVKGCQRRALTRARGMTSFKETVLLSNVVATGAGVAVGTPMFTDFTFTMNASGVTTGGVLTIETYDGALGLWARLQTVAVTANGATAVNFQGCHLQLRANLIARTDGTYSASLRQSG